MSNFAGKRVTKTILGNREHKKTYKFVLVFLFLFFNRVTSQFISTCIKETREQVHVPSVNVANIKYIFSLANIVFPHPRNPEEKRNAFQDGVSHIYSFLKTIHHCILTLYSDYKSYFLNLPRNIHY